TVAPDQVGAVAASLAATYQGTLRYLYDDGLLGFSVSMSAANALALSADARVAFVEQNQRGHAAGPTVQQCQPPSQPDSPTCLNTELDRIDQRARPLSCTYR